MRSSVYLAVLAAVSGATAFWRMECHSRLGIARIDPLISPGEVAQHAHSIHGSSGFSESATYQNLIDADCTSCAVTQDKSVYWHPSLYFQHANRTYESVEQVGGMLAYYFLYGDDGSKNPSITAFRSDFQMIAGNSLRRSYSIAGYSAFNVDPEKSFWSKLGQTSQADLAQRALGFNCLNYDKQPEGSLYRHVLPDKFYLDANCADGVRFEIMFPSCWNGKDLDTEDHKSHVAYPDLVMNGACPQGFDVKLPGLFYETIWAINAFNNVDGRFVIANGDVHGFGYHADFMNGWNPDFLQKAVETCTNASGKIQDCPIFDIQSLEDQQKCSLKVPNALVSEKIVGLVGNSLPEDVAIQYEPDSAMVKNPALPTTTQELPLVGYSEGAQATGTAYQPGQIFKQSSSAAVPSPSVSLSKVTAALAQATTPPTPTEATAPAAVDGSKYEVVKTDYITVSDVVSMIIVKEAIDYVTITTTTATATGLAKARREVYMHGHLGRHRHNGHRYIF
ncbi:hypothetical protein B0T26DRAFT_815318 [Lasiosphaeria miniovina]|uniref:DUF1996 domain-containing protein n=1 Tax=Lasiosphaeria miniovina TaxID=1954250 RepID=A0AA39ZTE9_9PEZI|nr:uncharacterized protein B0T26DRAFT_815318 [Lasiosphaeria miniovina]KAK0703208.1 hypothetical protein B0T26DRAFT_815318 [Lasiosphaeria miniovina]